MSCTIWAAADDTCSHSALTTEARCILSRDAFPAVRFLAVHTTTQINPRTLLGYEAEGRGVLGHHAMTLPAGHSRHARSGSYSQGSGEL